MKKFSIIALCIGICLMIGGCGEDSKVKEISDKEAYQILQMDNKCKFKNSINRDYYNIEVTCNSREITYSYFEKSGLNFYWNGGTYTCGLNRDGSLENDVPSQCKDSYPAWLKGLGITEKQLAQAIDYYYENEVKPNR